MKAWVNGALVDGSRPHIHLDDHGFTVGDGVFETIRTVHGEPFALTRHLARLHHSATGLGLSPPKKDLVSKAVHQVVEANRATLQSGTGRVRITYTSGVGPPGSGRNTGPTTLVVTASVGKEWPETAAIALSAWARNENSPIVGLKTTSYAENAASLASAKAAGYDEALLANLAGDVCEGTGSNIFVVVNGRLITPPLESGCLAGVTRDLVLHWCSGFAERIPLATLDQADEIFITSSTRGVHPVDRVGKRELIAPGPVTRRCQEIFAEQTAADLDP